MKKLLALVLTVALLASLMTVSLTVFAENAAYQISVDATTGQKSKDKDNAEGELKHYVVTGTIETGTPYIVNGWMLMDEGFSKAQYKIGDGEWKDGTTTYIARADVHGAFPGYESNNPTPGFGDLVLTDVQNLAAGEYVILVRGVGQAGTTYEFLKITLTVVAAGSIVVPDPTEISLDTNASQYLYCDGNQGGAPYDFSSAKTSGIQFKIPSGKEATQFVFIASPTWGNTARTGSDVLVTIYAWNTDYDTTVAGTPIDSLQIYGHKDCTDLIIQFSKNIAAGEYLMVLDANGGKSIGTWDSGAGSNAATFYINGQASDTYVARFAAMVVDASAAPQTGDVTVAVFAAILVVALAAVVVIKKRVNA